MKIKKEVFIPKSINSKNSLTTSSIITSAVLFIIIVLGMNSFSSASMQPASSEIYEVSSKQALIENLERVETVELKVYIKLKKDLDFKGVEFKPWVLNENVTFDGAGHTLKNIKISTTESGPTGVFSVNRGKWRLFEARGIHPGTGLSGCFTRSHRPLF